MNQTVRSRREQKSCAGWFLLELCAFMATLLPILNDWIPITYVCKLFAAVYIGVFGYYLRKNNDFERQNWTSLFFLFSVIWAGVTLFRVFSDVLTY